MDHPASGVSLPHITLKALRRRLRRPSSARFIAALGSLCLQASSAGAAPDPLIDFNRQIRPILSENCFRCHGFDEHSRKSGLRLDVRDAALRPAKSGETAIVPLDPAKSHLLARVTTSDPEDLMPPPETGKKLTSAEIDLLRTWIAAGAPYSRHWAFDPPRKSTPPRVRREDWPRNGIDAFVLANLESRNLSPSPGAALATLVRRATLDLTGVPPTPAEIDRVLSEVPRGDFLEGQRPAVDAAYERLVDRLLHSPRYGERMAVDWLDAARFADTNGYFGDKPRQMWPWRDWVIAAFNGNMPFDRFTIEQLAGDLLPGATREQRIATGFLRNSMANNESGIIDEEYRTEAIVDRIDATAATWLGLTLGCAQCHDHKFDPVSQREFYQVFAIFNHTPEKGLITEDDPPPVLEVPAPEMETALRRSGDARRAAERSWEPLSARITGRLSEWEKDAATSLPRVPEGAPAVHHAFEESLEDAGPERRHARDAGTSIVFEKGLRGKAAKFDATQHLEVDCPPGLVDADRAWSIGLWIRSEGVLGCVWSRVEPEGRRRGMEMIWQKGRFQLNLVRDWGVDAIEIVTATPVSARQWHHVAVTHDGTRKAAGVRVYVDGKAAAVTIHRDTLTGSIANREPLRIGRRDAGLGFYGHLDELRILPRAISAAEAENWFWSDRLHGILLTQPESRSPADRANLLGYFVEHHGSPEERAAHRRVLAARSAERSLRETIPTTLVMQDMSQPRTTRLLLRGQYDKPGEPVQPGVPAALGPWPDEAPRNRLGFARWLVSPAHPLTARVIVNRLWQQCFGEGLVRTVNDFGIQGENPTHPELLDWLSVRFVESGWNVRDLLRLIVTSATYRQSSGATEARLRLDPDNRLLARGPRFRLSGEAIRDQALATSGLLVERVGGPSVRPYQPPGLWEAVSYNGEESYVPDRGPGAWRRSLYSYWKRQAPPPALLTFDGPTREKCTVRRARTNTPLQALALLNDPTYVAAARTLAGAILAEPAADDTARLSGMFRRTTARHPDATEIEMLRGLLRRQRDRFQDLPGTAAAWLAADGEATPPAKDDAELAAWTTVAHTLFNLDEVVTRR